MSPRLVARQSALIDLISGKPVSAYRPATIDAAVESGAIGMGSFMVPILAVCRDIHIRHLRMSPGNTRAPGRYDLVLSHEPDTLLAPGEPTPCAVIAEPGRRLRSDETIIGTYTLTSSLSDWSDNLPEDSVLLLHVDCDYFNNRYDGDSDWQNHAKIHDPPEKQMQGNIDEFCDTLRTLDGRINDVTIALSPGFFPAEYWKGTVDAILRAVTVRRLPRPRIAAEPVAVRLTPGKGSPGRGGDPGGQFWHVYDGDKRAGSVWINQVDDDDIGPHPSLTIELNKASRGRGIGRRAYRLASEGSGLSEIWLHMRRSNIASRKAAEHAGYAEISILGRRQLVMHWKRPRSLTRRS